MKRGMMVLAVMAAAILSLAALPAHAAVVTYSYDFGCVISGSGCAPSATDWGSITFSGDELISGDVDIDVELSNSGWKLLEFGFNTDVPNGVYALTGDSTSLDVNFDGVKPDGYPYFFDFAVPATGNLGDVYTFSGTLNNSTFFFYVDDIALATDTGGLLFAYAHIGSLDGGESIWVGTGTPSVPEPSTLLLLGSGLVGMAGFGRKKFKK
jgi:hypothetical protein